MYVCMCVYVCAYVRTYVCVCACMYARMNICMYMSTYVRMLSLLLFYFSLHQTIFDYEKYEKTYKKI